MAKLFQNTHRPHDPVWHVQAAMIVAIILQLALPDTISAGTHYLAPAIEALLLLTLSFTTPKEKIFKSLSRRLNVLLLIVAASASNVYALAVITHKLLEGGTLADGRS